MPRKPREGRSRLAFTGDPSATVDREATRVPAFAIPIDHKMDLVTPRLKRQGIVANENLRALGHRKRTGTDECNAEFHGKVPSLDVTE